MQVLQPQHASILVWPSPRSLASTSGISVDLSSSRYLDVSVPSVRSAMATLLTMLSPYSHMVGLPHSDTSGSKPIWRLPEAFRSLIRVLHRLLLPRYPPCTLNSFCSISNCYQLHFFRRKKSVSVSTHQYFIHLVLSLRSQITFSGYLRLHGFSSAI